MITRGTPHKPLMNSASVVSGGIKSGNEQMVDLKRLFILISRNLFIETVNWIGYSIKSSYYRPNCEPRSKLNSFNYEWT